MITRLDTFEGPFEAQPGLLPSEIMIAGWGRVALLQPPIEISSSTVMIDEDELTAAYGVMRFAAPARPNNKYPEGQALFDDLATDVREGCTSELPAIIDSTHATVLEGLAGALLRNRWLPDDQVPGAVAVALGLSALRRSTQALSRRHIRQLAVAYRDGAAADNLDAFVVAEQRAIQTSAQHGVALHDARVMAMGHNGYELSVKTSVGMDIQAVAASGIGWREYPVTRPLDKTLGIVVTK